MTLAEKIEALAPDEVAAVASLVEHFQKRKFDGRVREELLEAKEEIARGETVSHESVEAFFREKSVQRAS